MIATLNAAARHRTLGAPMWGLLRHYSWSEWRQQPWRHAVAVLAVTLGVALGLAVHLINASALSEFSRAAQVLGGEPDLVLRGAGGRLDERWLDHLAAQDRVAVASPVIEAQATVMDGQQRRHSVRLLGVDAITAAAIHRDWQLQPDSADPTAVFAARAVFANAAATRLLGLEGASAGSAAPTVRVLVGMDWEGLRLAGRSGLGGGPVLLMDVAALQDLLGQQGSISRIDIRLSEGASAGDLQAALARDGHALDGLSLQRPDDAAQRLGQLSRAYRVNLTVLALVALFTGAFLVFSVISLGVVQRVPALALLGVLGLDARARQRLILMESAALGLLGSALGVALGTGLAWLALDRLGGDLGGGYFPGTAPRLQWQVGAALAYGGLGVLAALLGGWWPARQAAALAPARALKGLAVDAGGGRGQRTVGSRLSGPALLILGATMAWLPPVWGMPLAAYIAIACFLLGGVITLPMAARSLLERLRARSAVQPLLMLALERARRYPDSAAMATSGVVASLALSVALTVMVASFRDSVTRWLDGVLPAALYLRAAASAGGQETATLSPAVIDAVGALPGVQRLDAVRLRTLQWTADRPAVAMVARPLRAPDGRWLDPVPLPLVGPTRADQTASAGGLGDPPRVYISEAMVDLHGLQPDQLIALPGIGDGRARWRVAGVWRDYARQHGSLVVDLQDYRSATGDLAVNDLAIHLKPEAAESAGAADAGDPGRMLSAVRHAVESVTGTDSSAELTSAQEIRAVSLRIFDRSFAVTYWLQAVAVGMGLVGVAASFSAQVLARRREFGLLAHIGLSRAQVLRLVALEGAVWTALGTAGGLLLGLAVSIVLVHVVNPQSFHWTMDMSLPLGRLTALAAAVMAAGTATAWISARAAASPQAVLAVKQDW